MSEENLSQSAPKDGARFPVSAMTRLRPPGPQRWDSGGWQVSGVIAGGHVAADQHAGDDTPAASLPLKDNLKLWPGLHLYVHVDEAESYYFNLASDSPRVFVVSRDDDERGFEPFLATLSFDEAAAYEEGEDRVWAVDMPPEVHQWLEQFVLGNFFPEKRRKRKRDDWKKGGDNRRSARHAR